MNGPAFQTAGTGISPSEHFTKPDQIPGLYIHIPFCVRKCAYCGFYSVTDRSLIPGYLAALRREMDLYRGWAASFDTLYIGGGTPSVLSSEEFEKLLSDIRTAFTITKDAEITVEANPADIDTGLLTALCCAGVNRLNIGVQSFNDGILTFLGRRHDRERAVSAVRTARIAGIENIGIDLIYGIPGQEMPVWLSTLREAITLDCNHLSCYQLTLEEGTPLAEKCSRREIKFPGESLQADFFFNTAEILEDNGYAHYEVSNFARPGRESRHNRKYWNHVPYLGLGPAAHSFSGRERRWNRRAINAYICDLESGQKPVESREILNDEQLCLEALFLGFRTRRGICLETFKIRYGRDLLTENRDVLKRLSVKGLLEICDGCLRPTPAGMAVADSLALI
jgi:oxygen-independent coproporphyrinogen-3 oxidase